MSGYEVAELAMGVYRDSFTGSDSPFAAPHLNAKIKRTERDDPEIVLSPSGLKGARNDPLSSLGVLLLRLLMLRLGSH